MEHLVYDQQGQLLTGSLADYLIPTASDFPNIRAIVLEDHPSPINPLGAKGAGEGGIIAAGGIMANAVANALSSFGVAAARAAADADLCLGAGAGGPLGQGARTILSSRLPSPPDQSGLDITAVWTLT